MSRPSRHSTEDRATLTAVAPGPWLLVFDLDGTLIDSSLDLCLSVNAALRHVSFPELAHEIIASYIGNGAATLVRRALSGAADKVQRGIAAEERFTAAFEYFLKYYRTHKLDNTRLYDGVRPALDALRNKYPNCDMAVLTNKPVGPSREICEALGVASFFFANYGGDSFQTKKPEPDGLQHLMNQARERRRSKGLAPEALSLSDVFLVGDSDVDVLTARRAGVLSLGCTYGLAPAALLASRPDVVCHSPKEWPVLL